MVASAAVYDGQARGAAVPKGSLFTCGQRCPCSLSNLCGPVVNSEGVKHENEENRDGDHGGLCGGLMAKRETMMTDMKARRMATADSVLPAVQKFSPLLRKIAPEIYSCHWLVSRRWQEVSVPPSCTISQSRRRVIATPSGMRADPR